MQQYRDIKSRHQDAILFFRMGEFYEMFYDDAETASRTLGLTLTTRNNGGAADVPLAGVPVKALNDYLRRLVQHGFRVAICEQVEDPRLAKGIVRREVIETITPGVTIADDLLEGTRNNYVCAMTAREMGGRPQSGRGEWGMGWGAADAPTGELRPGQNAAARRDDAPQSRACGIAALERCGVVRWNAARCPRSHDDADGRAHTAAVDPRTTR